MLARGRVPSPRPAAPKSSERRRACQGARPRKHLVTPARPSPRAVARYSSRRGPPERKGRKEAGHVRTHRSRHRRQLVTVATGMLGAGVLAASPGLISPQARRTAISASAVDQVAAKDRGNLAGGLKSSTLVANRDHAGAGGRDPRRGQRGARGKTGPVTAPAFRGGLRRGTVPGSHRRAGARPAEGRQTSATSRMPRAGRTATVSWPLAADANARIDARVSRGSSPPTRRRTKTEVAAAIAKLVDHVGGHAPKPAAPGATN